MAKESLSRQTILVADDEPSIREVVTLCLQRAVYRVIVAPDGWPLRSPRLGWTVLVGYILSSLLTILNVGMTAWLMFVNRHDLLLATVLLLFASGIAISLGYFLSASLTDGVAHLSQGARQIAHGQLDARVPEQGQDELGDLARTFNHVAAQLERTEQQQRELDQLRRNLVAWIGHDLRTLLASVRVIVEALVDGVVEDPETVARYLATAQGQIASLSGLLDDLVRNGSDHRRRARTGAANQLDL